MQEVLETFFNSGLPGAQWPSKTYAVFKLQVRHGQNPVKIVRNNGGHAEENFINVMRANSRFNNEKTIMLYINYSPCYECVQRLREFLQSQPRIKLKIAFAHLYRIDKYYNREGLRELNGIENIESIETFTVEIRNNLIGLLTEKVNYDLIILVKDPSHERRKADIKQNRSLNEILYQKTTDDKNKDDKEVKDGPKEYL